MLNEDKNNKKNTQNILIVVFLSFTIFLLLILIIWGQFLIQRKNNNDLQNSSTTSNTITSTTNLTTTNKVTQTSTTTRIYNVQSLFNRYINSGYKSINLNIDVSENLKLQDRIQDLHENFDLNFRNNRIKFYLKNKEAFFSINNHEYSLNINNIKNIYYYDSEDMEIIVYFLSEDKKIYILSCAEPYSFYNEENETTLVNNIKNYTKEINTPWQYEELKDLWLGAGTIGYYGITLGVYNGKYYVIYDGRNTREYDANKELSYAKYYFNYTDVKANRHIYYKGTDLNYLYKMELFGNGTIKYLVTTENYLYNIATTKIENNSKIKYLLYSEQLNKMAIIYENGELFEFESFEI